MSMKSLIRLAAVAAVTSLTVSTASAQITIPTVPIGNPGNAPDATGFGSVGYEYNIGTTEVTNAQYAAFLNAKAKSDPFELYNTNMAGSFGGITRSGSPGSYTYATVDGRANHPVNFVSFWDACRFANWLRNGQGSGDTETGAYTLTAGGISANTITRNAGWQWAVTSENEWYKAAYHQPASQGGDVDDYWLYTTQSNAVPSTAQANYKANGINSTTPVGAYAASFYSLFDMGGNVWEWNEAIIIGSNPAFRGGSFHGDEQYLRADTRLSVGPTYEANDIGFRVSQQIPPCLADFDGSGFVDSDDFTLFVFAFSRGCTAPRVPVPGCFDSADYDQSGFIDSDDFIAYVQAFEAGC
jgi:sulfatase modifying factor 1